MSRPKNEKRNHVSVWLAIGAIFLIVLLILWLTVADLTGNTDVTTLLSPYIIGRPIG